MNPYVFGVWRDAEGVLHARAEQIPFPTEGSRRERVTAYLEAEARAFERHIAMAPEQWIAVFHPIWPDLEGASAPKASARAAAVPATRPSTAPEDGTSVAAVEASS